MVLFAFTYRLSGIEHPIGNRYVQQVSLFVLRMLILRRRIDDHIRELCAKATLKSNDELEDVLQELRALISCKMQRLKARGARLLLSRERLEPERRKVS